MKYSILINQKQAIELGIKNLTQGHIFDLLAGASTWATTEIVDGEVYYWVSRQRISDQLPLAGLMDDTVYRNLRKLADIGLIEYIKVGKKDCVKITPKGRHYYFGPNPEAEDLPMSDLDPSNEENSDLDPNELGFRSENDSDLDPTYKTINNITPSGDKAKEREARAEIPESEKSAERVAFHLFERLVQEIPEAANKNPAGWVKDIERAIRIDKIPEQDLIATIDWMHTGDRFWVANIQSGKKLRDKYATMAGQMRRPKPNAKQSVSDHNKQAADEAMQRILAREKVNAQ